MNTFENKTIILTGCGGGIGSSIMERFASLGASIIACELRENEELTANFNRLTNLFKTKIHPIYFDLSDDESIRGGMKELYSLKVPIDVLINNAGYAKFSSLMMSRMSDVKKVFQINYFSVLLITQYVVKLMLKNKQGAIVNLGSIAGLESTPGNCAYGASKASLMAMTRYLAQELSPMNIRVNAVAPSFIQTNMQSIIDTSVSNKELDKQAIKRFGLPKEVASVVTFLASDEASYINGQVIRIDGGM